MIPQHLIEAVISALDQVSSIQEAESLIADEREKNPQLSDELSDLLEQFREEFARDQAPTNLDYSRLQETSLRTDVPRNIGPYEIGARLGQGGFGQVFVAKQSEPVERRVAIKLIRPERSSPQVISRFKHERQAMAEMNHPNIAKIFDGGVTEEGRPYFVMELVNGLAINRFVQKRDLDILRRLKLFLDVCRGVQHAHQKGVIHRDLKPSNIIVGEADGEQRVKIIDFGVAKMIRDEGADETNITKVSQMIGTPRYMSPEQAALDNSEIDSRSDIYSLGVILYELLTGETPITQERLDAASFDGVRQMICEEDPVKPSQRISRNANQSTDQLSSESASRRNRLVRGDLDWIVMKALEKEPNRRYRTASNLADDIVRFLNDEPIVARPPSKIYRAKKFVAKHRILCSAAAIVFLTMSAATAFSTYYAIAATNAAEAERIAKTSETNLRIFAESKAGEAELSRKNETLKRKQAEAIRDTLAEILKSPGPMSGGANVTVKKILVDSVDMLEEKFSDDPETKFLLMNTIGTTLFELGNFESAIQAFSGALDTQPSENNLARWYQAKVHLARSLAAVNRVDEAKEQAQFVIANAVKELGGEELVAHNAKFVLVNCYIQKGKNKEAIRLAEQTFALIEENFAPESPEYLEAEIRLGDAYVRSELYGPAKVLLKQTVEKHEAIYGPEHFKTKLAKSYMAEILSTGTSRQRLEGKAIIEDYLTLVDTVIDADHPEILANQAILSRIHAAQGEFKAAIELQRQVVATATRNFGEESVMSLKMRLAMTRYLRMNRDFDMAYRELTLASNHPAADSFKTNLDFQRAEILMTQRKFDEARNFLNEALEKIPDDAKLDPMVILMHRQLALAYFHLKEDDKSLELFERVRGDLIEHSGEFHPKMPRVYRYLALLHERGGRVDVAIENYKQAIAVSSHLYSESDPQTIELINMMGMCYLTGRNIKKHIATVKKAVDLANEHLPDYSLAGHRARFNLAVIYRNQKQYAKATPLLEKITGSHSLMPDEAGDHEVFDMAVNELASNYMFRRDEANASIWFPKYFRWLKKHFEGKPNYYASNLVQMTTELNRYGIYDVAEKALQESLKIRSRLMPESWLLDNTRSVLAETRFLRAKREAGPNSLEVAATKEIEKLLIDSFEAMESKLETIPTKYRVPRLTSAAKRLVAYYEATSEDESKNRWIEKIAEIKQSY